MPTRNGNPSDPATVSDFLSGDRTRGRRFGTLGGEPPPPRCHACGKDLPAAAFAGDASKASGRKSVCKACDREKSRRWYAANRDRKIAAVVDRRRAAKGGAA